MLNIEIDVLSFFISFIIGGLFVAIVINLSIAIFDGYNFWTVLGIMGATWFEVRFYDWLSEVVD